MDQAPSSADVEGAVAVAVSLDATQQPSSTRLIATLDPVGPYNFNALAIAAASTVTGTIATTQRDVAQFIGVLQSDGPTQHDIANLQGGTAATGAEAATSHAASAVSGVTVVTGAAPILQALNTMGEIQRFGTLDAVQRSDILNDQGVVDVSTFLDSTQAGNRAALAAAAATTAVLGAIQARASAAVAGQVRVGATLSATQQPGRTAMAGAPIVGATLGARQVPNTAQLGGPGAINGVSIAVTQLPNTAALSGELATVGRVDARNGQVAAIAGAIATTASLAGVQAANRATFVAGPIVSGALVSTQQANRALIVAQGELYTLIGVLLSVQAKNVMAMLGGPISAGPFVSTQQPNRAALTGSPVQSGVLLARQALNRAAIVALLPNPLTGTIVATNFNRTGIVGQPRVIGALALMQQPNRLLGSGNSQYGSDPCYVIADADSPYLIDHLACVTTCMDDPTS